MAVKDWSATAGSNTTVDGINIAEGCPPGNINDAIRSVMANVRGDVRLSATGLHNWIINPNKAINQRGVTSPAVGVYGPDRWKGHAGGLEQIVEGLPAGEWTLSWAGGGTASLGGNSGTSPITATLTAGNTSVVTPAGATEVVLVPGPDPVDYAQVARPIGEELALCQRYYWRFDRDNDGVFATGFASSNSQAWVMVRLPQTLRSVPTVQANGGSLYGCYIRGTNAGSMYVESYSNITEDTFIIKMNGGSGMTTGEGVIAYVANGSGGWISADAEL